MNYYCKILIKAPIKINELSKKISSFLNLDFDKFLSSKNDILSIDIQKNKEFDEIESQEFPDGFLFYPYFLDIDIIDENRITQYKVVIKRLLEYLWEENYQAVASCDFEEDLPHKGGYNQMINKEIKL
ncbi:hypothetical protein RHO13_09680 [Orbus wheelerorum]|uniref:1,4-dihydroxy-6-naphthoate synthase n=1 Tax=Orbus wheelerorum TaxID=3074111 RepID=UPI00370DD8A9